MPHFPLSELEIASIIRFLFDADRAQPPLPPVAAASGERAEHGQGLFNESRCLSCHSLRGKGGTLAPELDRVGAKVQRPFLVAWLKRPKAYSAQTIMPRFRFTDEELNAIADYVLEEFEDEDGESWRARARSALARNAARADAAAGRKLVRTLNCAGCHTIPGLKSAKIGPDLSAFGDKDVHRLDFGSKRQLERSRSAWLAEKLRAPRGFSTLLRMPQFELGAEELQQIATAVLSFRAPRFPAAAMVAGTRRPWQPRLPRGEVGELFRELSCLECHAIDGRGGTLAPDLSYVGSQVQRAWLVRYLKEPHVIRPSLVERMLPLRLDDAEVALLADYLISARQLDGVPRALFGAAGPDAQLVARGRALFTRRGCGDCHITSHSQGYLGPELTRVAERLQPGWIHLQLRQPNRYRPGSIEPDLGLSEAEALALTAYLSGLRGASAAQAPGPPAAGAAR